MQRRLLDDENVYVIDDFFSAAECDEFIARGERQGFEAATITTATGPVMNKGVRDNSRVIFDDVELAERLYQRARLLLPPTLRRCWHLVGFNERWREYRYDPGEKFAPHYDGTVRRSEVERSHLTFMIYLNDDFMGGETRFYFLREDPYLEVQPVRGQALVFVHEKLHEGAEVLRGRKYVLRTDVMYRLEEP